MSGSIITKHVTDISDAGRNSLLVGDLEPYNFNSETGISFLRDDGYIILLSRNEALNTLGKKWTISLQFALPTKPTKYSAILSRDESDYWEFGVDNISDQPHLVIKSRPEVEYVSINIGAWNHLLVSRDTLNFTVYLNGLQVMQNELYEPSPATRPVVLGAHTEYYPEPITNPFMGLVRDIRIYQQALITPVAQILQGVDHFASQPIRHWPLDSIDVEKTIAADWIKRLIFTLCFISCVFLSIQQKIGIEKKIRKLLYASIYLYSFAILLCYFLPSYFLEPFKTLGMASYGGDEFEGFRSDSLSFPLLTFGGNQLDNPNFAGMVFGLGIILATWERAFGMTKSNRYFLLFTTLPIIIALLLSQSKAAIFATFLTCIIIFISTLSRNHKLAFTTIVTLTFLALATTQQLHALLDLGIRSTIYSQCLDEGLNNPFFGLGALSTVNIQGDNFSHCHNIFLDLFRFSGLLGVALLIALLYTVTKTIYSDGCETQKLWSLVLLFGLINLSTDGFVPLTKPTIFWLTFWLPISIIMAYSSSNSSKKMKPVISQPITIP
ncbi:MAG: hypothetical protein KUG79_09120 [Pseudomonadales bacterium]|nr:hypothetical protein [Pseudomonadales bacterium]